MNRRLPIVRAAAVVVLPVLACLLVACSSADPYTLDAKGGQTARAPTKGLDVPPDLTQLARENRYSQQGGVISAAATPAPGTAAAVAGPPTVAPQAIGEIKVLRDGNQRWLVVPAPPEQLWPQVRAFWVERGFAIAREVPEVGLLETDWAENRAKLPQDPIRATIGRAIDSLYDTGERDRFRTRIERGENGTEIYIAHRGMQEVYADNRRESTIWQPRPSDPLLEAELLGRLMAKLGTREEVARATVAAAPEVPARARVVAGANAALEVDEPFDRAWRRVGLALDRSGFTVEDRDRAGGLYFVRYVDPKNAGKDEPGFFSKLFGSGKEEQRGPLRYRIAVKGAGEKTQVSVLSSSGAPEMSDNAQRIIGQLVTELR